MIFNLDRLLAVEQPVPSDDRVFPFDVFISHRRFDLPTPFLTALSRLGINLTWDNDLDLRDRRVIHAVSRAMESSRFIALYVSNNYLDSLWCKAEYLSGIRFEQRFACPRVLVILESKRASSQTPVSLKSHPSFVADAAAHSGLAAFLVNGNKMSNCDRKLFEARESSKGRLGPDTSLLDTAEQLNLLEQRLQRWLEIGGMPQSVSELEKKSRDLMQAMRMPFTEIESILSSLLNLSRNQIQLAWS